MIKIRKHILTLIVPILLMVILIWLQAASNDRHQDITEAVHSLNHTNIKIAQIKKVDSNKAIVFYQWGYGYRQEFGYVSLTKNLFGWRTISGETSQLAPDRKMGWEHTFYPFQKSPSLLTYGKIVDPKISKVVLLHNTKKYVANIVNYDDGERFWYFSTNTDFSGYLVIGLSKDGKTLEAY